MNAADTARPNQADVTELHCTAGVVTINNPAPSGARGVDLDGGHVGFVAPGSGGWSAMVADDHGQHRALPGAWPTPNQAALAIAHNEAGQ